MEIEVETPDKVMENNPITPRLVAFFIVLVILFVAITVTMSELD